MPSYQQPVVGVVVVNWNGRADTLECLRAVAAVSGQNCSLFLVDNGCQEFSTEEVAELVPGARYLHSEVNLGFAGGANLGMREALRCGAAWVWFLNNDAQPEPGALTELLVVAQSKPEIGIVGAKILQRDHPERLDSIALHVNQRYGRVFLLGHDEVDILRYDQLDNPAAVTACAMLVSRSVCERLGGFDESFFAYLEDADLCLRARAAGFRVAVAPRARVMHKRAVASRGRQSVASLYYATRNHLLLIDRHSPGTKWQQCLRRAVVVALNAAYAARSHGGSPVQRLRAVCCGVRDYRRGVLGGTWG